MGSSWTKDQTCVPCISRQILIHYHQRSPKTDFSPLLLVDLVSLARAGTQLWGKLDPEYLVFSACLEGSGLYQQGPRGSRMVPECMSVSRKWMGRKVRPSALFSGQWVHRTHQILSSPWMQGLPRTIAVEKLHLTQLLWHSVVFLKKDTDHHRNRNSCPGWQLFRAHLGLPW